MVSDEGHGEAASGGRRHAALHTAGEDRLHRGRTYPHGRDPAGRLQQDRQKLAHALAGSAGGARGTALGYVHPPLRRALPLPGRHHGPHSESALPPDRRGTRRPALCHRLRKAGQRAGGTDPAGPAGLPGDKARHHRHPAEGTGLPQRRREERAVLGGLR